MDVETFAELLHQCQGAVERYVRCKIANPQDAQDVLQEILLAAFRERDRVQKASFKPWLLGIARHKTVDYYRAKARTPPLMPLDGTERLAITASGRSVRETVWDTLARIADGDRRILELYYLCGLPQAEIAQRLGVPLGTVKSRLYTARERFRGAHPAELIKRKGACYMKQLPQTLPDYCIEPLAEAPFPVRWEELLGWFLIPRLGERVTWGMYDWPERKLTDRCEMAVCGRANIHGVEGVEIRAHWYGADGRPARDGEHAYFAQLTGDRVRMLAESYVKKGVRHLLTFLDGDDFIREWGFGPENCGWEINLVPQGRIQRTGNQIHCGIKPQALDIVGRYRLTLGGREYDTVCAMLLEEYDGDAIATEQYLDARGRTILWRRFNRDDWAQRRYGMPWTQRLPDNEQLEIDGKTYVHWYDCLTDYIC